MTKPLVGHLWSATLYSRQELEAAFAAADFRGEVTFKTFLLPYVWLNPWSHIVEASG